MPSDIYEIAVFILFLTFGLLSLITLVNQARENRAKKKFDRDIARVPDMRYYQK